jgi:hypothetical protein
MAVCTAFFMARRKATRRSSWVATFSPPAGRWSRPCALLDVQEHLVRGQPLHVLLQRLDAGAALADHDAGARGVDVDLHLVGGALDLDRGNAGVPSFCLTNFFKAMSWCSHFE